jgi:hypothetical protein
LTLGAGRRAYADPDLEHPALRVIDLGPRLGETASEADDG